MRIQRFIGLAVCMGSFAAGASAQNIHFVFPINGQQAVPQTPSPGLGTGIVSLIPASNEIVWDISWSGLSGPVTAMHFHGPAGVGATASPQLNIGMISGLTSPSIGRAPIDPSQAADLVAGLWYVNIHTAQFATGEIRGQIVPAPGAAGLLAACGLFTMGRRRC